MEILVTYDGDEVFNGLAEEFLYMQENDSELENALDVLEQMIYGSIVKFEGMLIEKIEKEIEK